MALLGMILPLALALQLVSSGVVETAEMNSIVTVKLSSDRTKVLIDCALYPGTKPAVDQIYPTYLIGSVTFNRCPVPNSSYSAVLAEFGININSIMELTIIDVPNTPAMLKQHFDGLSKLATLKVFPVKGELFRPERDFLAPLEKLETLHLTNMELPPMPALTPVTTVQLENGSFQGEWGGCEQLLGLSLKNWTVPDSTGTGWLSHCPKLVSLKLTSVSRQVIDRTVNGASILTELTISKCDIPELNRGLIASAGKLAQLKILNSGLTSIASDAFSSHQQSLSGVDLSENALTGSALTALAPLRQLKTLILSDNPNLQDFCEHFDGNGYPNMVNIEMSRTGLPRLCFRGLRSLVVLQVPFNNIHTINFEELPLTDRPYGVSVIQEGNPVKDVLLSKEVADQLAREHKTMPPSPASGLAKQIIQFDSNMTIKCSGEDFQRLQELIRDGLIVMEYKCYFSCEPCQCSGEGSDVIAWCSHVGLTSVPHIEGLKELHADGNNIQTLEAEDLPKALMWVDLRNNNISVLPAKSVVALLAVRRAVKLAGNPISCECDNIRLLRELRKYAQKFLFDVDYNQMTCAKTDKPLHQLDLTKICAPGQDPDGAAAMASSCVLTALALLTIYFN